MATPDHPSGKVARIPRRRISVRQRASIRMAELYRIAKFRKQFGVRLSPDQWVYALAVTLASAPPGSTPIGRGGRAIVWSGLDIISLRRWLDDCGLVDDFHDNELRSVIGAAERWREENGFVLMRSDVMAQLLAVTAEERWACRIKTIGAVDESRDERQQRQKSEKNERDKKRMRTSRAGQHKPRAVYLEQSLSALKPWEAEGISRRTWERRRARVASVSPDISLNIGQATDLRQPEERPANTDEAAA